MKKLYSLFFVLMLSLSFFACESDSGSGPATKTDYDYSGENPPAFATTGSADLHYTLPDQTDYWETHKDDDPVPTYGDVFTAVLGSYTLTENIIYTVSDDTGETTSTVSGYNMDQFVVQDTVNADTPDPETKLGDSDARKLYAYVAYASYDSFDNRTKFSSNKGYYNPDLIWDQFSHFYLLDLNYTAKVHSPLTQVAGGTLANMYNNKRATDIYMFRKIDVKRPDSTGSIATFEVGATTDSYVNDDNYFTVTGLRTTPFTVTTISFDSYTVDAISLDQFITTYVVAADTQSDYTYTIVAVDDFKRTGWTWAEMQNAYYLPDYDFICQVDSSTNTTVSGTKINFPVRIEVIE